MSSSKLGFGMMRLPQRSPEATDIDFDQVSQMVDRFLEAGFTYFDTSWAYHNGASETAVKRCLVSRHPRDRFVLASKLPTFAITREEEAEEIFAQQLERCGVDYFDYYLLHNMGTNVYDKSQKYDAFGFAAKKKAEGKIKYLGMSFHDMPELLDEILEKYGEIFDFIQLQINYVDWEQPNVQSRRCLEVANKYKKPVFVMEPCKGGTLVNLPDEALKLIKDYNPDASAASWAFRFVASQEGVVRVLSGMNSMEQVMDNTATFKDFKPITEEELAIIDQVRNIIEKNTPIPCTACSYCTHGCPKQIAIPQYFALYNSISRTTGSFSSQAVYYNNISLKHGKASDCIGCKQCEKACPQHLQITDYLKDVAAKFEAGSSFPTKK